MPRQKIDKEMESILKSYIEIQIREKLHEGFKYILSGLFFIFVSLFLIGFTFFLFDKFKFSSFGLVIYFVINLFIYILIFLVGTAEIASFFEKLRELKSIDTKLKWQGKK